MEIECDIDPVIGGQPHPRPDDRAIAGLAARQHGVVARAQLRELGLGSRGIDHRLECGRLHSVYRGVYAVGHRVLSREGRWMAAVLAAGRGAVLSHRSAAALWGMRPPDGPAPEVTVDGARHRRPGLLLHRSALPPDEITTLEAIPVTTPPRTLLDLAAVAAPRHVERAANEAEVRRLAGALSVRDMVERHPHSRGIATLRAILEARDLGATVTRSELEDRFLAFIDAHDLPRPRTNAPLMVRGQPLEVDCLWRDQRLIVELDGHATHATPGAYEIDRNRDRMLSAAGWRVVRVTWRQLHRASAALAADLRALLAGPRDRSSCPSRPMISTNQFKNGAEPHRDLRPSVLKLPNYVRITQEQ